MSEVSVPVTKIQKFCTHDGPGVRTTVFFKGCPLHCAWCHNPETQSVQPQIFYSNSLCVMCGACAAVCPVGAHVLQEKEHLFDGSKCIGCLSCTKVCMTTACEPCAKNMNVDEIMNAIRQDKAFYGKEGGVTLSGGEPMVHPEVCLQILKACRAEGISTAMETCGFFDEKYLPVLAELVDVFLWDFKDGNDTRHKENTGVSNVRIRSNLHQLDAYDTEIRLRCIMVKGINMSEDHYDALARLYHSLAHCTTVELLPYHAYGGSKSQQLGFEDNGRKDWIPTEKDLENARAFLHKQGVTLFDREKNR